MAFAPPPTDEQLLAAVEAFKNHPGNISKASSIIGLSSTGLKHRLGLAAKRGLLGTEPVLPGFSISKTTAVTDKYGNVVREFIQQKPENAIAFEMPQTHVIKGISALVDGSGNEVLKWIKTREDDESRQAAMDAALEAFKERIPKSDPVKSPKHGNDDLLNQYTVTDLHFGMLAWREETGADYDLKIAEKLLLDWFAAAIQMSPNASTAVL